MESKSNKTRRCEDCGVDVLESEWLDHLKSTDHRDITWIDTNG